MFRLVTEHTIEEKIVERAQQKLKLDAMVVQQGRLKDKDKLSREELLAAVRFGADKIFKSKDSSITDDDIDLILDAGKRKTQELNDKLKAADKGDLLDFKLDGSSVQTFEGVDYSNAQANKTDGSTGIMLGLFDIGKRERKEANYNENSLYQQQMVALGVQKKAKKKLIKLPRNLRLPRMEEWQMYDRETLNKIQEEEEAAFKALPEEQQKLATAKQSSQMEQQDSVGQSEMMNSDEVQFELPPLIDEEKQRLKDKLLAEGFSGWLRVHFNAFVKASAQFGRSEFTKIAMEVEKSESEVKEFASAFWGDGKSRFSEHEYDRAVKMIERGEKKLKEIGGLERGIRILVSLFENPWEELEFSYVNCRDKMYSNEEDRHLICWMRKYGYGQWQAIRMAIRRNPKFRFNYFFRSLPVDQLVRRCEQLAKAVEKEVEQLERKAREDAGLPTDPANEGDSLPPVELLPFRIFRKQQRKERREKAQREKKELEAKVEDIDSQIRDIQQRLRAINEGSTIARVSPDREEPSPSHKERSESEQRGPALPEAADDSQREHENGCMVGSSFQEFPEYDGSEEPLGWKKPFTLFCIRTRRGVKASLEPSDRKDKDKIHTILKDQWNELADEDKSIWKEWTEWDKKRYARDIAIYEKNRSGEAALTKKDKKREASTESLSVPKKKKRQE